MSNCIRNVRCKVAMASANYLMCSSTHSNILRFAKQNGKIAAYFDATKVFTDHKRFPDIHPFAYPLENIGKDFAKLAIKPPITGLPDGKMWAMPNLKSDCNEDSEPNPQPNPPPPYKERGPSPEQLEHIFQMLSNDLPKTFALPFNHGIYHPKVIFENNIRGTRSVGLTSYYYQLSLMKMLAHIKFAYVKFVILKITKHPEDGTIRCRWRIQGINATTIMFQFWKINPMKVKEACQNAPTWYDGFSTFYVGSDGLIFKHIADKMQPDDYKPMDEVKQPHLAAKIALFLSPTKATEPFKFQ